jgi:transmembrane sensor
VVLWRMSEEPSYSTGATQRSQITLADGSVVNMAPGSEIRVIYSKARRTVLLERGEALFYVAKNRQRPFLVGAGSTSVRAVGTAFDVDRTARNVAVTVVEGVVQLTTVRPFLERANESHRATNLALRANQQVFISTNGIAAPVHAVDGKAEVAWVTGEIDFDDEPISHVVAVFNRFNHVQISVADPGIASRHVSGSFHTDDPDAFVDFLKKVFDIEIVPQGQERIVIYRRAAK